MTILLTKKVDSNYTVKLKLDLTKLQGKEGSTNQTGRLIVLNSIYIED